MAISSLLKTEQKSGLRFFSDNLFLRRIDQDTTTGFGITMTVFHSGGSQSIFQDRLMMSIILCFPLMPRHLSIWPSRPTGSRDVFRSKQVRERRNFCEKTAWPTFGLHGQSYDSYTFYHKLYMDNISGSF
ncbi:hypothetical protein TNCV_3006701 [Trichonephila clavipes]|nr:hypothetical protein TNCV_3006701 [Trichonephila clavipes]